MTSGSDEAATIADGVRSGRVASGARAIRWLEDGDPRGREVLDTILSHTGRAHWVGVTGPPGAGKSTLVGAMVAAFRARELRVGVLAIDPTSPFSGGAILGDRVRMQRHATDPGVFIRSMATRGRLGGLCRSAFEAGLVLDAMGFDLVLIETVGVGQDELEVVELAHTTIVVNVPGLGDDVQALKAGILEVGELFVLNKADRPGADETEKQLRTLLHLRAANDGTEVPLFKTVSTREEGVAELVDATLDHFARLDATAREAVVAERNERFFREVLEAGAATALLERAARDRELRGVLAEVRAGDVAPHRAAERLVQRFVSRA